MDLSVLACVMEPGPTTEIKQDNKEAENSENRLSCALHLAGHKSACTGLSAL